MSKPHNAIHSIFYARPEPTEEPGQRNAPKMVNAFAEACGAAIRRQESPVPFPASESLPLNRVAEAVPAILRQPLTAPVPINAAAPHRYIDPATIRNDGGRYGFDL